MKSEVKKSGSYILEAIKALIIATIISLVLILVAAFIIKMFSIKPSIIPIIVQVIKGISILTGILISLKLPHNGWIRGIVIGILYIAFSFLIFSLLNKGEFNFGINILNDIAIGSITGMISGIIASNLRK